MTSTQNNRTAPYSIDSEWAVIGSVLFDNAAMSRCDALLSDHFYIESNARIWGGMRDLIKKGSIANGPRLVDYLGESFVASFGGEDKLADFLDYEVFGAEINDSVKMIIDTHQRRELIRLADELRESALGLGEGYTDPAMVLTAFEGSMDKMRSSVVGTPEQDWSRTPDLARSVLADVRHSIETGGERGIATGIAKLDNFIGGLRSGDLVIVAGASSMGKTCVARNIAFGAGFKGKRVALFSQEMSEEQLAMRTISAEALRRGVEKVDYRDLDNATVTIAAMDRLDGIPDALPKNIVINSRSSQSAREILIKSRSAAKMLGGLDLIVVDYLQIMNIEKDRGENHSVAVGKVTGALKALAKDMGCPVIVLSQLARLKGREDKRPTLDDLRDSGSIEQDADKVFFVYRENYYIARQEPDWKTDPAGHRTWQEDNMRTKNKVELYVAKNRMGRIGPVDLWIDLGCDLVLSDASELQAIEGSR